MPENSRDTASVAFTIAGETVSLRGSGSLWHAQTRTLVVSDLHLGKAERNARRGGGFWPPYENEETLTRLEEEISELSPRTIVTLGDSFDDDRCVDALDETTRARISGLVENCRWIWVSGNHDPAPVGLGGQSTGTVALGTLTLRHIAKPDASAEVSGHYHPKAGLRVRGRRIARKCFLADENRLILPAFGAFTGGLDVFDDAFRSLIAPDGIVVLTGRRAARVPLRDLRRLAA